MTSEAQKLGLRKVRNPFRSKQNIISSCPDLCMQRSVFSVDVAGMTLDAHTIDVSICQMSGHFTTLLPAHVSANRSSKDADDTSVGVLSEKSLDELVNVYELACSEYQAEVLKGKIEQKLMVFIPRHALSIDWRPVNTFDGKPLVHVHSELVLLIDDTENNRARLDAIVGSIQQARNLLHEFSSAADPNRYLEELKFFDLSGASDAKSIDLPMASPQAVASLDDDDDL